MELVLPRRLVLVDVGPLYAVVDPEDQYHARARDEMQAFDTAAIAIGVTWPTVAEAQSLVLKKLGPMVTRRWLDDLLVGTRHLSVDAGDYLDAVALMQRFADQRLTMFDCLLYLMSQRRELPVWTYDFHFDVLGARRWYGP